MSQTHTKSNGRPQSHDVHSPVKSNGGAPYLREIVVLAETNLFGEDEVDSGERAGNGSKTREGEVDGGERAGRGSKTGEGEVDGGERAGRGSKMGEGEVDGRERAGCGSKTTMSSRTKVTYNIKEAEETDAVTITVV